jgi:ribosomal protection tetracycline resistance protein
MPMGSASGLGTRDADFTPYGAGDTSFTTRLADLLADHDDAFLAAYLQDETTVSSRRLRGELAAQTRQALVHPVCLGSARTGAGVEALIAGSKALLPAAEGEVDGPVAGADPRRGRAGMRLRPLPTSPRHDPDPPADRPQSTQPQGVPAARHAAGLAPP